MANANWLRGLAVAPAAAPAPVAVVCLAAAAWRRGGATALSGFGCGSHLQFKLNGTSFKVICGQLKLFL